MPGLACAAAVILAVIADPAFAIGSPKPAWLDVPVFAPGCPGVLLPLVGAPALLLWSGARLTRLVQSGRSCATCGYDLRGLIDRRCPECGHDRFDGPGAPSVGAASPGPGAPRSRPPAP